MTVRYWFVYLLKGNFLTTPYHIVEEYVFHPEGLSHVIHGRVIVSVGLGRDHWAWETDYVDGSHKFDHSTSAETARNALFEYVNNLDTTSVTKAKYY